MKLVGIAAAGGAAIAALALALAPAVAASTQQKSKRPSLSLRGGSFTPAVSDPRLAAELARRGFQANSFRFTPSSAATSKNNSVRLAVRARVATPIAASRASGETSASPVTAITPTAYNLGVSVGWKRFALSGDVAQVRGGPVPGGRKAAEVDVSYSATPRLTGRIELGAAKSDPSTPRIIDNDETYSVGVGGSFRLTRNLDVTGGVRYKIHRDRLETLADDRRDSQAVYIGTAFRF